MRTSNQAEYGTPFEQATIQAVDFREDASYDSKSLVKRTNPQNVNLILDMK